MKIISQADMIALEARAVAQASAGEYMERAGRALASLLRDEARRLATGDERAARSLLVLCGKGNNAGDGLVLARVWSEEPTAQVIVALAFPEDQLEPLPQKKLAELLATHAHRDGRISILSPGTPIPWPHAGQWVVEAWLGLGLRGPLRAPFDTLVQELNAARARRFFSVCALDLPAGITSVADFLAQPPAPKIAPPVQFAPTAGPDPLVTSRASVVGQSASPSSSENAHLGRSLPLAVEADLTATLGYAKDFLVCEELSPWVGRIEVLPLFAEEPAAGDEEVLVPADLAALQPRRSALSYKKDFGRVIVIGGSVGMTGAPILAVRAALAAGAGLVNLAVATPNIGAMAAALAPPEVMVSAADLDEDFLTLARSARVLAVGPGLAVDGSAGRLLARLFAELPDVPLVLDAGALRVLAAEPVLLPSIHGRAILTPHAGEMRALLGRSFDVRERAKVARALAEKLGVIVVLKGTRTIVAVPDEPLYYNTTGNAGLAKGGSGDVLTGVIAALVAQNLKLSEAARVGVWWHGRAADEALATVAEFEALWPSHVIESLGSALRALRRRAV